MFYCRSSTARNQTRYWLLEALRTVRNPIHKKTQSNLKNPAPKAFLLFKVIYTHRLQLKRKKALLNAQEIRVSITNSGKKMLVCLE